MTAWHSMPCRRFLAAAGALIFAIGLGNSALAGSRNGDGTSATMTAAADPLPNKSAKPLYYQDPDGKPSYSSTPMKTGDGRDFVSVYEDRSNQALSKTPAAPSQPAAAAKGKGRILYYRNPMGLPDTSPTPKKDSMGMDYIPVYENETGADANVVQISPGKLQLLGVRTVPVESRKVLARTVRATGTVQLNERTLAVVTTKVGGWVEQLHVSATGETVKRGDPLFELYAPDLVATEEEYLVLANLAGDHSGNTHEHVEDLIAAATQRLRALGIPSNEIERLQKTGKVNRTITIRASANGVVTEKAAVEGMRIEPDSVLYRTADLSAVWLIAQVQERDLGGVAKGQHARASFVAFPSKVFDGAVDFVYPTLSPDTRTAQVRIVVSNPDLTLRAGMYASVEIETPVNPNQQVVLTVPDSAIIDSGSRQVVLIERGEGRFEPRDVKVGNHGDGYTEISKGVKDGERVVVGANFLIDSESNLRAALQSFTPATGGSQ